MVHFTIHTQCGIDNTICVLHTLGRNCSKFTIETVEIKDSKFPKSVHYLK